MKTLERIRQAVNVLRGHVSAAAPILDPGLTDEDIKAGFRRISGQATNRDLSPLIQDRMIELAWYLYDRNPLAKRMVDITKDFVVGDGLKATATDPDVQAWLDKFWDDPVNRLDLELPDYVKELSIFGEQLYIASSNPVDGSVRLWYVDPSEIEQVVWGAAAADIPGADRSIAIPIEIVLKQKLGEREQPRLHPFRPGEDPSSPAFGRPVGDCFYFAVNKAKRGTRGRSDIFAQADWLDAYEQVMFAGVDRVDLLNNFVWDVMLKGKNEQEIADWLKQYGRRPRPGSLRAHNENVEWKAVAPELGSADVTTMMRAFKNHILGSKGFPEMWFAEGGETNLATAGEMGAPIFKTLSARQKFVKYMLVSICNVVIDRGIAHGSLPASVDRGVDISAPELAVRDVTKLAAALQQTGSALSMAQLEGWLTRETAAKIFAVMASELGQEVDAAAELEKLGEGLLPVEQDYKTVKPPEQQTEVVQ